MDTRLAFADEREINNHIVLVVDDDEDVHRVTEIALRSLSYQGRDIEIWSAHSAGEALDIMRKSPPISVVLMDVVMETDQAGLDACRQIREDLNDRFARILLRTGQPGMAPERRVIQEYDVDGYLPKGELTSTRLFTMVRASLKAFCELTELDLHRRSLQSVHDCVTTLTHQSVDTILGQLLEVVYSISLTSRTVLLVDITDQTGTRREVCLSRDEHGNSVSPDEIAQIRDLAGDFSNLQEDSESFACEDGYFTSIKIDHGLGSGWLYIADNDPHQVVRHCIPLLMTHGANAIYGVLSKDLIIDRTASYLFES
nr:response regulator [Streptomyces chartreusis]